MALNWIAIERATIDKPELLRIARKLKLSSDAVLGKLVRLWFWFDSHSVDGRVDGVVSTDIDRLVDARGFAQTLSSVGWLQIDEKRQTIVMPNFERHHGKSAKKRALATKRQQRWRDRKASGDVDAPVDASASTTIPNHTNPNRESPTRRREVQNPLKRASTPADNARAVDKNRRIAEAMARGDSALAEKIRREK